MQECEVGASELEQVRVIAWLHYQPVPPHWVDPLRRIDAKEAKLFVEMYERADKTPETLAVASRFG